MVISVIVPTWNRKENIINTVKALLFQEVSIQHKYEIIVVDDHSTDGTFEALKDFPIKLLLTPTHTVWNASIPRNYGALQTDINTDMLYFVDSDVLLPPDRIQRAIDIFERDPDPKRVIIGPYHFMRKRIEVEKSNWYQQKIDDYDGDIRWRLFEEHEPNEKLQGLSYALASFGGNIIIPRKLFFKAGGFDEQMKSGVEDGDFGLTLWETNATFSFDRGLLGWHNPHTIHKERTQFIKECVELINSKHNIDIIKLTGDTYRKWGINWTPPDSWVEQSGYKPEEIQSL